MRTVAHVLLELLVVRLEELDERPDRNVLEGRVVRLEEAHQVAVQTAVRLVPHCVERRIVVRLAAQVAQRRGRVALHLDRRRGGEREEHLADAHVEQLRLEVLGERQDRRACSHLALDAERDVQRELLDALDGARIDDRRLVPLAARRQVAQRADRVALQLLVLLVTQELNQGVQEARVDDRALVLRVDRHVAHARGRREDQREERRAEQAEQRREAVAAHDLDLVLFVAREVAQRKRRLALHLEAAALHQPDQVLHEARLALRELLPVHTVHRNVAQRRGAVVLHIRVGTRQERYQHRDCTRIHELLPVLVAVRHVQQRARRVALYTDILRARQARKRHERTRLGNLGLVVVVRREVRNASHRVALHFHVRAQHLPDQRLEATQLHNQQLVLGVHRKVAKRRARRPLHLNVMGLQQEQHGLERLAAHLAHLLLGDLRKGQRRTPLQVHVIAERERGQRPQRLPREKVGLGPVCVSRTLHTLEVLKEVCDRIPLVIQQERLVLRTPRSSTATAQISHRVPPVVAWSSLRAAVAGENSSAERQKCGGAMATTKKNPWHYSRSATRARRHPRASARARARPSGESQHLAPCPCQSTALYRSPDLRPRVLHASCAAATVIDAVSTSRADPEYRTRAVESGAGHPCAGRPGVDHGGSRRAAHAVHGALRDAAHGAHHVHGAHAHVARAALAARVRVAHAVQRARARARDRRRSPVSVFPSFPAPGWTPSLLRCASV